MPLFRPVLPASADPLAGPATIKPLTANDLLSPEEITERKRRRRWFILLPLLLTFLVGVGFGARPALHLAKAWQARRTAVQAERFIQQQRWTEARGKVQDALQLWQGEPAALRAAAILLSRTGNSREAVTVWKRLEEVRPLTRDEEREYTQVLLANHDLAPAERHPHKAWPVGQEGSPKDWELGMQLAFGRHQPKESADLARRLLATPAATLRQRLAAALTLASTDDKEAQAQGWGVLSDLSTGQTTPESLEALLILTQRALSLPGNAASPLPATVEWPTVPELVGRIEAHSLARIQHHLLTLDLQMAQEPGRRAADIQTAIERFAGTKDDADLGILAGWLYGKGEFDRVLAVLPLARAVGDPMLFFHRLDALAALDRWADIRREIQSQKGIIDPMLEQMYLARCAAQLNESKVRDARWDAALDLAGSKPEKLLQLGGYAQKTGNLEVAIRAFSTAAQAAPDLREAHESLLRAYEAKKDTRRLRDTISVIAQRWPQDAAARNDAAYFDALLGENLPAALGTARQLVRADPSSLPHRVTLALAELRSGNGLAALDQFASIDLSHTAMQPRQRAVLAAVFWATSYPHEAREALRDLPMEQLLPEERALLEPIVGPKTSGDAAPTK